MNMVNIVTHFQKLHIHQWERCREVWKWNFWQIITTENGICGSIVQCCKIFNRKNNVLQFAIPVFLDGYLLKEF
jgi:hypothetical protein